MWHGGYPLVLWSKAPPGRIAASGDHHALRLSKIRVPRCVPMLSLGRIVRGARDAVRFAMLAALEACAHALVVAVPLWVVEHGVGDVQPQALEGGHDHARIAQCA